MKKFVLFVSLFAVGIMAGCATNQFQKDAQVTAQVLTDTKAAIIAAGTTLNILCANGTISKQDCDNAGIIYNQATGAWNVADSAFQTGVAFQNMTSAQAKAASVQKLVSNINVLMSNYTGAGKKK